MLTIKEASEFLGVSAETLRRWEKAGKITSHRTEGSHRRYDKNDLIRLKSFDSKSKKLTIGYCRVSSSDQKDDLKRQIDNVSNYCIAKGYSFRIIDDLGSGLNYNKKGLKQLIELISANEIERIVINYKDRLLRFGYELIEQLCLIHGVEIEIINHTEDKTYEQELVEDVLSVITVFSAKLYGSRSYKIKKIKDESEKLFK
ncbi:IS607 family transposase [Serpentinicella alkaliphila]|uniref:Excisionase family DNA binding protein n=1 Tax=Serpentinicella alkaliphila TaxID=1734049 RepID=A0A4R2THB0_9FIRM|nr:IS607 family transposase [Serpentinicella alkaliphila]QUH26687.1 IS607 family transposase [Serpentinicella alkaliphila]TCQ00515.1 excisionase family DNA binding protein [Serpentinicella alkaliphila]